jgi:predicted anti-sigma-YlaC factor YlaD
VGCDQYREALSADLDGEPTGVPAAELEDHLGRCAGCRGWYAAAARVTRLARLAPAAPVPDLAPAVLAALPPARSLRRRPLGRLSRPAGGAPRIERHAPAGARAALVAVAFVQALLAWSGALTGRDPMVTGHVATEVGAWNLALAVAFLAAATRPRTAEALVAPVGVFVAVLAVSAVSDAVAGELGGGRLAAHLLVAAGLALLLVVARSQPAAPPADVRPVLPCPAGPDPADGDAAAGERPLGLAREPVRTTRRPVGSARVPVGSARRPVGSARVPVGSAGPGPGSAVGEAQPAPVRAGSAA